MPWTKLIADSYSMGALPNAETGRVLTYSQAVREAQAQAMAADENVIVMGEGVDDPGGIFGSTLDLHKEFGPSRCFDLPIAENASTGMALGAAIAGLRPIYVHMRMDFMLMGMDQLVNHVAKWRYMTNGAQNAPLVIRALIGRGWGSAAQHSQNLQGMFMQVPGLKIVMPVTPMDAKGMLLSAIADDGPVIFLEHRWLYGREGQTPEEMYFVPLGKGQVLRRGGDVTICALSLMVCEALEAAKELAEEGVDVEVIDMRSVKPVDEELLLESVHKTGRLILADTGNIMAGWSAEIAALVGEKAFDALKGPVARVGLPDIPTPASSALEDVFYPGKDAIKDCVRRLMARKVMQPRLHGESHE